MLKVLLKISSHKTICQSCNDSIDQFQKNFPNMNIRTVQILDELNMEEI